MKKVYLPMKENLPNPGDFGYILCESTEVPVIFIHHPLIRDRIAIFHSQYVSGNIDQDIAIRTIAEDAFFPDWVKCEYGNEIHRTSMQCLNLVYLDINKCKACRCMLDEMGMCNNCIVSNTFD